MYLNVGLDQLPKVYSALAILYDSLFIEQVLPIKVV